MSGPAHCRSCGAEILWATNVKSGKSIPLDPAHRDDGNLVVADRTEQGGLIVRYLTKDDPPPTGTRYVSHFATCPNAKQHRR